MIRIEHNEGILVAWDLHTHALIGKLEYFQHADGSNYVRSLFVDASKRRQGVATSLLRVLLKMGPVSLHVNIGNHGAENLYRGLGFVLCSPPRTGRERFSPIKRMERRTQWFP